VIVANPPSRTPAPPAWLTAAGGALVALLAWTLSDIELRYALAIYGGVAVMAALALALPWLDRVIVYALFLHIPFSIFGKWLFYVDFDEDPKFFFARGINLGGAEVLLLIGYTTWLWRIISRVEAPPRLNKLDAVVGVFVLAEAVSMIHAPAKLKAFFDLAYLVRCVLIYFYLSRRVGRQHLAGILAMLVVALVMEASLAMFEVATNNVGFGKTKGNAANEDFGLQYEVPGFGRTRAEGTTIASHSLGLFFVLTLPVPFVLMTMPVWRPRLRLFLAATVLMAGVGLLLTYSRAAWFGSAISLTMAMAIMTFSWRQYRVGLIALVLFGGIGLAYTFYSGLRERLMDAPEDIMTMRYDTYWTALDIWRQHPFFGYGAMNYLDALDDPAVHVTSTVPDSYALIVHNVFLLVASETGAVGVIGFFGSIFAGIFLCRRQLHARDPLVRAMALALMTALVGSVFAGLTDSSFKDYATYTTLWSYIGLSGALARIAGPR
jgi:hypothetical protein